MSLKSITILLLIGLFSHQAMGTVTLDIQTANLRTSGGTVVPANTTMILVSDTDGFSSLAGLSNELLNLNLAVGSTFGTNSKILNVLGASDLNSGDFGYNQNKSYDLTALGLTGGTGTSGTDLAILWFPGLTGTAAQTLGNGQSFGFYRSDIVDGPSGGSFSFNMPTDGSTTSIYALDTNLGGGIAPSTFNATGTVGAVPEPSRSMLAALGLACLIGRRKRN
ncbi:MAG: PEP-CTERM sorting domain-containing protein [Verrucomicrobia bacterium]|nr:PEP-CTERM sorting domain-containing protein [Verrucomicrobiota bacterium]